MNPLRKEKKTKSAEKIGSMEGRGRVEGERGVGKIFGSIKTIKKKKRTS